MDAIQPAIQSFDGLIIKKGTAVKKIFTTEIPCDPTATVNPFLS
jgi:hypothetical protein